MISQQYELTQKKLEMKLKGIQKEKKDWETEKALIAQKNHLGSEVLSINIGGTNTIMVSQKVITSVPDSSLAKMFNGMHQLKRVDDHIFLDRDSKTF